jgi:hypothetical protein
VWSALLPLWIYALVVGLLAAGLGLAATLLADLEARLYVQLAVAGVLACGLGLAYPAVVARLSRRH